MTCEKCGLKGHNERQCYRKNMATQFKNEAANEIPDNIRKIREIERRLGKRIEGKMRDFKRVFNVESSLLDKYVEIIPPHLDIFKTLRKNELLTNAILDCLPRNNVNMCCAERKNCFDVTRCRVQVNSICFDAIIDSGASFSFVSREAVEKANLPVKYNHSGKITLANGNTTTSSGKVKMAKIEINDSYYPTDLIILEGAAQPILLGTNWLKKYKVKLCYDRNMMSIRHKGENRSYPISCVKIGSYYSQLSEGKLDPMILHSAKTQIVEGYQCKFIDIKRIKEGTKIPTNSVLYITGNREEERFMTCNGVTDSTTNLDRIMVINPNKREFKMEKNQKVGKIEILKESSISKNRTNTIDVNKMLACYRGEHDNIEKFTALVQEIADKQINKLELPYEHTIKLKDDINGIKSRLYRTNLVDKEEIERQIQDMLSKNIIRESYSSLSSPIVLVNKKDGMRRFCIDYRLLNRHTIKDCYPLPRIDDSLDRLRDARFFSKIDLTNGYWSIPIKESDKYKTAFQSHNGLFEFNRMPFGLTNAPSTFQRTMNCILNKFGWKFSLVYLDDVIIFSKSAEEHLEHIRETVVGLLQYNLDINFKKSEFFNSKIEYLGFKIKQNEIQICDEKISAVKYFPRPSDKKTVQQFLGLVSYYRRFIKDFSSKIRTIAIILRKDSDFIWNGEQEKCL